MTPVLDDPWLTIYGGDVRDVLPTLPAESVHMVCTSPPYWGLRDYGTPGQLGLEPTPEEYVANMVAVFREVRRVLRSDGTVWLNLGDSYAGGEIAPGTAKQASNRGPTAAVGVSKAGSGLRTKNLVGIPWRVAFALQADGWYLRSDVIWSKPNPMPESVTDRPTKSHEYLFLLSKAPRYFWDADAVREPHARTWDESNIGPSNGWATGEKTGQVLGRAEMPHGGLVSALPNPAGRNLRSVWNIATAPYPGAHFATFPPKLVEPCIKASTSERGVCPECGAPWVRETSVEYVKSPVHGNGSVVGRHYETGANNWDGSGMPRLNKSVTTTGWRPSCAHDAEPVPATVLDIFAGSGTVGMVAQSLSRRAVLIDLNPDYLRQCLERNAAMPLGLGA